MSEEIFKFISSNLDVFTVIGASWWVKRWINKVDKRLEKLEEIASTLKTSEAVSQERHKLLVSSIDNIREDMGIMKGSDKKIWKVLEKNQEIILKDQRMSDNCEKL